MKVVSLLLVVLFIFSSCGRMSEQELWTAAQQNYEQQKFKEAIDSYRHIVEKFSESQNADSAQLLIAAIYNNELQDFHAALAEYRRFTELYPTDPKVPKAMFLIGFIYNNQLHNIDSAKLAYEAFLAKFPIDELAASAQMEIQTLGKDPSELIQPKLVIKEETPKGKTKSGSTKAKK